jgi:hypothetical protein
LRYACSRRSAATTNTTTSWSSTWYTNR